MSRCCDPGTVTTTLPPHLWDQPGAEELWEQLPAQTACCGAAPAVLSPRGGKVKVSSLCVLEPAALPVTAVWNSSDELPGKKQLPGQGTAQTHPAYATCLQSCQLLTRTCYGNLKTDSAASVLHPSVCLRVTPGSLCLIKGTPLLDTESQCCRVFLCFNRQTAVWLLRCQALGRCRNGCRQTKTGAEPNRQ